MKVSFSGTILRIGEGVNNTSGKGYRYADIYAVYELIRVFNFPDGYITGQSVDDLFVNLRSDTKIFASCI